ncbi:MAG: RodZ domain-containing protein [Porticoccaceae bacterium]
MSSSNSSQTPHQDPVSEGAGPLLRRAREGLGLSQDDLSRQLGISRRTLQALEQDDYGALPGEVYVRGYLRTYCNIVKLRPSPVLACFADHVQAVRQERRPTRSAAPRRPLVWMGSCAASLMACTLVSWALYSEGKEFPAMFTAGQAAPAAAPPLAGPAGSRQAGELTFDFHADSWVEVIDANDHILAVDLYRSGDRLALDGKPPFRITLGHAPGVAISYRGAAVELAPDPETLAAEITVGR